MSDINFEKDQEEVLDKTENIDKLSTKVKELRGSPKVLKLWKTLLKKLKKIMNICPEKLFQP